MRPRVNIGRIYRLLRLVTLLQSGRRYTAGQLAEELQVSRRTVFRDLNALELAHIPYYYDPESKSYRISRHFFLSPVNLTLGEALSVLALAGRMEDDAAVPLLGEAVRAAAKIQSTLPPSVRDHVGTMLGQLAVRIGPTADHEGVEGWFDRLSGAIHRRRVCEVEYDSFFDRSIITRRLHPMELLFVHRAWYLRAWSETEQEVRTYKLIRIRALQVLEKEGFSPPSQQGEASRRFGLAWSMIPEGIVYTVHLRFAPKVGGNVAEVQWHQTQQTEFREDGSLDFRVRVDGLGEITWWILGYGDQVQVISPKSLARRVAGVARKMLAQYESPAGGKP